MCAVGRGHELQRQQQLKHRQEKQRAAGGDLPSGDRAALLLYGAALLACGGLSNLVDRFARGSVTDYLRFPRLPGRAGRLVWNLADFMILAGAALAMASEMGA